MRPNESVKEFSIRVKQACDEAKTIISSKYKDQTKSDLTINDLWELIACDSIVRSMQSSSKYRHDYNEICNTIDDCVTVERLSEKASKVADRRMILDDLVPEQQSYLSSKPHASNNVNDFAAMEKRLAASLKEQMTLMARNYEPKSQPKSDQKKKAKPWSPPKKWNDPVWRSKHVNEPCHKFQESGSCTRTNCPYAPCNKSTSGQALYNRDF